MSKITKKILGASLSLAAFSFGYISTASAQTCTQPMTCEEMDIQILPINVRIMP